MKWNKKTWRPLDPTAGLPERENRDNGCKKILKQISQGKFPELKDMSLFPDWKGLWVASTMDENKPDHATSDQGWWQDSMRFQTLKLILYKSSSLKIVSDFSIAFW